jgi:flagellar hook-length control protein FliK
MQAALKFFEFPFKGSSGKGVQKIAIRLPDRQSADGIGEDKGFMEVMAALTKIPQQELQASLDQLDWVPMEENSGEFVPMIDLTAQNGQKNNIVNILWPQQGATVPAETGQTEQPIKSELYFSLIANDQNPKSSQMTEDKNGAHQYVENGDRPKDAVSSQKPELKHGQSSFEFLRKDIRQSDVKLASLSNHEAQQSASDKKELPVDKKAIKIPLLDPVADKISPKFEQIPNQVVNESAPKNPQALRSNAFENSSGNDQLKLQPRAMAVSAGNGVEDAIDNDTTEHMEPSNASRQGLKSQVQQHSRLASMVMQHQKMDGNTTHRDVTGVQGVYLHKTERAKETNLKGMVRVDQTIVQSDDIQSVKFSDGADTQSNNASTREGAPSFDSRLAATNPKTIEQGAAAKEVMPFVDKETNSDVIRQIVQRMTLLTEKQQSKMVIQLKPDFLGNVRLHVTTANQQVTVRMEAESMVVKDIIEHNMPHLKVELHQHGLEIEKFDVFVGNDNDETRHGQQQAGLRQNLKRNANRDKFDDLQHENKEKDQSESFGDNRTVSKTTSNIEVDYFA